MPRHSALQRCASGAHWTTPCHGCRRIGPRSSQQILLQGSWRRLMRRSAAASCSWPVPRCSCSAHSRMYAFSPLGCADSCTHPASGALDVPACFVHADAYMPLTKQLHSIGQDGAITLSARWAGMVTATCTACRQWVHPELWRPQLSCPWTWVRPRLSAAACSLLHLHRQRGATCSCRRPSWRSTAQTMAR